jgi:hypothetical protein
MDISVTNNNNNGKASKTVYYSYKAIEDSTGKETEIYLCKNHKLPKTFLSKNNNNNNESHRFLVSEIKAHLYKPINRNDKNTTSSK